MATIRDLSGIMDKKRSSLDESPLPLFGMISYKVPCIGTDFRDD